MALSYSIDRDRGMVTIVGTDYLSLEERRAMTEALMADPALPAECGVLIDVAQVVNAPGDHEMKSISHLLGVLHRRCRRRIGVVVTAVGHVTVSTLITFGVDDPDVVRTFLSAGEAREWIGGYRG